MGADCWCDAPHEDDPQDLAEALRNLGHAILAELRIPELVAWLERKLSHSAGK